MKKLMIGTALAVAFAGPALAADISIATIGPMTGQYASFGAQMKAGAEQAVADINAAGGVNGKHAEADLSKMTRAIRSRPSQLPVNLPPPKSRWLQVTSAQAHRSLRRTSTPKKASFRFRRHPPTRN